MKTYYINKANESKPAIDNMIWNSSSKAEVNCFPWDKGGYKPNTTAQLLYSDLGLTVRMETNEKPLLARFENNNDAVCNDSCMEFFVMPNINEAHYFNFEINPKGTMLLGYGTGRADIVFLDFDKSIFDVESKVTDEKWELKFFIPYSFVNQLTNGFTENFKGNFFKCGDETVHPHYGCWNNITAAQPDFHRPECFGEFIFL